MKLERKIIKDIIVWDVENWAKAIKYWEKKAPVSDKGYNCLELGSSKGGIALWLALNGNNVLCTDLKNPEYRARPVHSKYPCAHRISYDSLNATDIPFENHYDMIVFKSIIGGICSDNKHTKVDVLNQIHKALKPGGRLLFAENLEGSLLHKILRKYYGTRGWNYLNLDEFDEVFSAYKKVSFTAVGFFGCMGRNEWQRNVFGKIDSVFNWVIPQKSKYIVFGVAEKGSSG